MAHRTNDDSRTTTTSEAHRTVVEEHLISKELVWVSRGTPDGFKDKDIMKEIRKAAMRDHLRKTSKHASFRTARTGSLTRNRAASLSPEETTESFTPSNEWALLPKILNSPPSTLSGLITPPESRRTSGEENDQEKPARQSLPSIHEALGRDQPPIYPTTPQSTPSTLLASEKPSTPEKSEWSFNLHPHGLSADHTRNNAKLVVSSEPLYNACGLHYRTSSRRVAASTTTSGHLDILPDAGLSRIQDGTRTEDVKPYQPILILDQTSATGQRRSSLPASRIMSPRKDQILEGNTLPSYAESNPFLLNESTDSKGHKLPITPEDQIVDTYLTANAFRSNFVSVPIERRYTMFPDSKDNLQNEIGILPVTPSNSEFARVLNNASISPYATGLVQKVEDLAWEAREQDVIHAGQSALLEDSTTDYGSEDQQSSEELSSCTSTPQAQFGTDYGGEATQLLLRKQKLVDSLMREFYSTFDAKSNVITHGSDSSPSSRHQSTGSDPLVNNSQLSSGGGSKRKVSDDDSPTRENDEEYSKKRPKRGEPPAEDDQTNSLKKLACPYFKRNPRKYQKCRSCPGPGWDTVHRLKEHLYRRHALPIQCPRCYGSFKSETALKEHQRSLLSCEISEEITFEGFDKDQEKRLRSRKRSSPDQSEEDKWREVYRILFPEDELLTTPSPYYDYDLTLEQKTDNFPGSTGFARYEEFLSRELPRHVRKELELAMDSELEPIEDRLKSRLVDIVRSCQEKLFRMYQESLQPPISSEPSVNVPVAEVFPTVGNSNTAVPPRSSVSIENEDQLATSVPPSYPALDFSQLDQSLFSGPFLELDQASDAGYNSLGWLIQPVTSNVNDMWS